MALNARSAVITVPGSTGVVSYTGFGFDPKVTIFIGANSNTNNNTFTNLNMTIGVSNETDSRTAGMHDQHAAATMTNAKWSRNDSAYAAWDNGSGGFLVRATSYDNITDGFSVNWASVGSGRQCYYMSLGGSSITNTKIGTITCPASTGNLAVTGVGFQPDYVMFFGTNMATDNTQASESGSSAFCIGHMNSTQQMYSGIYSLDNNTTSDTSNTQGGNGCYVLPTASGRMISMVYVSMDTDGFTVNFGDVTSGYSIYYLAIKGVLTDIDFFNFQTSTGAQAITGVGFLPEALWLQTTAFETSGNTGAIVANLELSIGASATSSQEMNVEGYADDAQGTSTTGGAQGTNWNIFTRNSTYQTNLTSFDSDGFTLNVDDNAGSSTLRARYVAFRGAASPGPANVKTFDGVTQSSGIKSYMGVLTAATKTVDGVN